MMTQPANNSNTLKSLDKILVPLIVPVIKRRGLAQAAIILDWSKIVNDLADLCVPMRLNFPFGKKQDGTLHLFVDSGAALRMEYIKDMIISRINGYFGYNAVAHLKFKQTSMRLFQELPLKKPDFKPLLSYTYPLDDHLATIDSEKLRAALKSFGQTIQAKD